MIKDSLGRTFKKLRVSITQECNFACTYCVTSNHDQPLKTLLNTGTSNSKTLSVNDLSCLIERIHRLVNLKTVRITGGEPLINPDAVQLVENIKRIGIYDIRLTTNGFLLPQYIQPLERAGLKSVNISIDAITENTFKRMTLRNGLKQVIKGIDMAIDSSLDVKLNSVIMKGMNDNEIFNLLDFAKSRGIIIRFLELMPMGPMQKQINKWFYSEQEILQNIQKNFRIEPVERQQSSTANYWRLDNGQLFGIIANESTPFCADCNRLRLDNQGNIYGCLSTLKGINIQELSNSEKLVEEALGKAILHKQPLRFEGNHQSMKSIGG